MKLNKKGQVFEQLGKLGVGVGSLAIILVVVFLIMSTGKSQIQSTDGVNSTGQDSTGAMSSNAWNATGDLQNAVDDIPGWIPIVIITSIGAILIGLVKVFGRS